MRITCERKTTKTKEKTKSSTTTKKEEIADINLSDEHTHTTHTCELRNSRLPFDALLNQETASRCSLRRCVVCLRLHRIETTRSDGEARNVETNIFAVANDDSNHEENNNEINSV